MDLSQLADQHLGSEGGPFFPEVGPASRQLWDLVRNETTTQPLIGTLFWQAFTELDTYDELLRSNGLSPTEKTERQEIIVRHGPTPGFWSRYDLLVLDPKFQSSEPISKLVEARPDELAEAASSYSRQLRETSPSIPSYLGEPTLVGAIVAEAATAHPFGVIIARPPETFSTAIAPAPAWEVLPSPGEGDRASAGVVATDRAGRGGVTSADHAFQSSAKKVTVAGISGTICSRHPISDSCFVEAEVPEPAGRAVSGPLSRVSPREGEVVAFHGVASESQSATVTGWDKGIPFEIMDWNRLRVFTGPITDLGDSGAALLDSSDQVIGFSFDRTGYRAAIEYSSWIWAEFVYNAHGLR